MRIINLIENTEGYEGCAYAHGLSFYVETSKHKLLSLVPEIFCVYMAQIVTT